jgi:hypothetical protein
VPQLEAADIFRRYGHLYRDRYGPITSLQQWRVMRAIERCRTAQMGGHVDKCDNCGHLVISYNSCRNRHCPKCQTTAKTEWLHARCGELLPVGYFHVVFTIPDSLAPLALQNKRVLYDILFQTASKTMLTIAADPRHLGAAIGFIAILHTWGQTLMHHPHLHCVVPGGGLSPDNKTWIPCRPGFFLPVRVLSRLFRRLFLESIQKAFDENALEFHGKLSPLCDPRAFRKLLDACREKEWVVYAKPPFKNPRTVLEYLARYTHRVAISNNRLLDTRDGKVTFSWKDYRHNGRKRKMTLEAHEFIRRFLLHVLPSRFVRIRYYGLSANCHRSRKLILCRSLLNDTSQPVDDHDDPVENITNDIYRCCPLCGKGNLLQIQVLQPSPPFYTRAPPERKAS